MTLRFLTCRLLKKSRPDRYSFFMEQAEVDQALASYKRCLESPEFFPDFYRFFKGKGSHIVEKFKNTDMNRQMEALRHGLQYMIMFASGSKIAAMKIEDLGITHDRYHRDIRPEMYDDWLASLLETIQRHDPEFNEELAMSWRNVLGHGIRRMKAMY